MPIYEYRCDHCGIIDRLEQIGAVPHLVCSACGCGITKLISICSFTLDTDAPGHPDRVQKKNEERKMHLNKGNLNEWQNEHSKKYYRDRYGIGGHFGDDPGKAPNSKAIRRTKRKDGHILQAKRSKTGG